MVKIEKKRILTIGAHSDDVEYYAGGTLLKMSQNNDIFSLVATNGSLNGDKNTRESEQELVSTKIGAKETIFLKYPDLGLEAWKDKLQKSLIEVFLTTRPHIVFSFDPENQFRVHEDFHPDHRVLSIMVVDLIHLYLTLPDYLSQQHFHCSPLINKPELWLYDSYKPNHYEDISGELNRKINLLMMYKSQKLDFDNLYKTALRHGRRIHVRYSEAFRKITFCSNINSRIFHD